ncbi:MAG TPA: adenylosuccinate lyase [Thermomicrobiales bacterium]|nr:adenylosuccinate lyase [Thermomicrobiales bacterium]
MIEKYTRPAMGAIWSEERKIALWLKVEVAVCEAWAEEGAIPAEALPAIRAATVDLARMREIERETEHDVIAFLRAASETAGEAGRFIHLGLTSSDVIDTALSLQVLEALDLLLADVDELRAAIGELALRHKDTVMIGRTHGIHAEPTTFGLKLAGWYDELGRARRRLAASRADMAVGKISGAVGTHANVPPVVEERVCAALGLAPAPVSTQIVQRDRHAAFIATLAVVASSLDKFATEIRHLQRTEVREAAEPFGAGQQGSSAMPHKRNPVLTERVSGLARVLRGYSVAALETVPLWHERDISNSSAERIVFPDACIALDYTLALTTRIMRGLSVYPERMRRNLDMTQGLVYSQRVLLALVEAGLDRQVAYKLVQRAAMRAWAEETPLLGLLEAEPEVTRRLPPAELAALFDPDYHVRFVDEAFRRVGLLPAETADGRRQTAVRG